MELLKKTKTCNQRLTFTLTKHPLFQSGQCCPYIESSLTEPIFFIPQYITIFSKIISAVTVNKTRNIALFTSSIVEATKYPIITT